MYIYLAHSNLLTCIKSYTIFKYNIILQKVNKYTKKMDLQIFEKKLYFIEMQFYTKNKFNYNSFLNCLNIKKLKLKQNYQHSYHS